jgi:hypothetical protein
MYNAEHGGRARTSIRGANRNATRRPRRHSPRHPPANSSSNFDTSGRMRWPPAQIHDLLVNWMSPVERTRWSGRVTTRVPWAQGEQAATPPGLNEFEQGGLGAMRASPTSPHAFFLVWSPFSSVPCSGDDTDTASAPHGLLLDRETTDPELFASRQSIGRPALPVQHSIQIFSARMPGPWNKPV